MKKTILLSLSLLMFSGCVMAYNAERISAEGAYEQRNWICSVASKSNARKAKAGGIEIERGNTEAQPEVIESIVKGAVKGAVGK